MGAVDLFCKAAAANATPAIPTDVELYQLSELELPNLMKDKQELNQYSHNQKGKARLEAKSCACSSCKINK